MKKMMLIAGIILLSLNISRAQTEPNQRIPLIGSETPSFKANSTNGKISFPKDFGKNWKIVFSHPRDFTPVCSSEILELAYQQDEFARLGADIIVVSTDKLSSHNSWKAALEEVNYKGRETVKINFPLVEDTSYFIANSFGMLDHSGKKAGESGQSIRGVFFIDPEDKIRAFYFYPNEVGRNVEEIKRTLVALQTNYKDKMALLPANWKPGEDIMVPYLHDSDKDADGKPDLTKGFYNLNWFMTYKKAK